MRAPTPVRATFVIGACVAVSALVGALIPSRHLWIFVILGVVALLTARAPFVVPAILLVGPAVLHVLTYVSAGFATRGDVLSSPVTYLPVLAALFGPPVLRTISSKAQSSYRWALAKGGAGRSLLVGVAALLALLAVRAPGSPSPIYAATKTFGFASFSLFPTLLTLWIVRGSRDAKRVADAIVVIGGGWLVLALAIAATKGNLNLYRADPGAFLGGVNEAAGGLGGRAGIVAIVALGTAIGRRWLWPGRFVVAALAAAVLVLTGHRGSVLGFVIGILVLVMVTATTKHGSPSGVVAVGLIVLGFGIWWGLRSAPEEVVSRYQNPFQSTSFQDRLSLQSEALGGWRASPLIGQGTGATAAFSGGDQPRFGAVNGLYPHNITVELLVELGLVGATLFYIVVGRGLLAGVRALRWRGSNWIVGVFLALAAQELIAMQGGADLTIHNALWIVLALLAVSMSDASRAHQECD